jgi:DNA-binding beta-propeller fold protein YncE
MFLAAVLMTAFVGGCAKPAGVIFEPLASPVFWPQPPEPQRIRYVGQLTTSADLKPAVPFGKAISEFFFGKGESRSMLTPMACCTDGADRLFVADSNAQCVHVFDLDTREYHRWVPGNPEKRFSQPVGIAYHPAGKVFVADSVAGRVFAFDARGKYLGEIGEGVLVRPCGVAVDAKNDRLYVSDVGIHQVVIFSATTQQVVARLGGRGMELGKFNFPTYVAVDSQGQLYVSDSLNFRIQQFSPDFMPIRAIGKKGDMPGYFSTPKGLALDSHDHLYVVDANFEAVQIFDSQGQLLLDFGQEGRGPGEFWLPNGIFIDPKDRIWVADTYNRRIEVFDYVPENQP